jgi:hypothetical protein
MTASIFLVWKISSWEPDRTTECRVAAAGCVFKLFDDCEVRCFGELAAIVQLVGVRLVALIVRVVIHCDPPADRKSAPS